ncbi:tetraspanin-16-like isoform X1 [Arapaima gigas]
MTTGPGGGGCRCGENHRFADAVTPDKRLQQHAVRPSPVSPSVSQLSGFAFLGFGVWMKYDSVYYVEVTGLFYEHLVNLAYICMGMGALLCLVGLIGLCAAKRENWCLITLVSIRVPPAAKSKLALYETADLFYDVLYSLYLFNSPSPYKCCGFENSIQDFVKSKFTTNTGLKYPKICCIDKTSSACDGNNTTEGLFYPESCFGKLVDGIQEKFYATGSTASIVCVLEFLAMMISVVLFLKRSNEEYHKNQGTSAV